MKGCLQYLLELEQTVCIKYSLYSWILGSQFAVWKLQICFIAEASREEAIDENKTEL